MGPRSRLMLLAAVLGGSASFAAPAVAQAVAQANGGQETAESAPAPSVDHANPQVGRNSGERNASPPPGEQVPTFPGGCPFRDKKLELIV